jgi:hypothetical protein
VVTGSPPDYGLTNTYRRSEKTSGAPLVFEGIFERREAGEHAEYQYELSSTRRRCSRSEIGPRECRTGSPNQER